MAHLPRKTRLTIEALEAREVPAALAAGTELAIDRQAYDPTHVLVKWHDGAPSPWTLKDGVGPTNGSEVVIDAATAKKGDIKVGDTITITTENATREFTVVGLAKFAGQDGANGSTFALFDLPTGQEFVLGEPDKIDFVSVAGDGSMSEAELSASIQSAVRLFLAEIEMYLLT